MPPELQDYDNVLECQQPGYSTTSYKDTKCHLLKHSATPSTNQKVALYGKLSKMQKTYGWNCQPQGLGGVQGSLELVL
jgi:hypothetical protein